MSSFIIPFPFQNGKKSKNLSAYLPVGRQAFTRRGPKYISPLYNLFILNNSKLRGTPPIRVPYPSDWAGKRLLFPKTVTLFILSYRFYNKIYRTSCTIINQLPILLQLLGLLSFLLLFPNYTTSISKWLYLNFSFTLGD